MFIQDQPMLKSKLLLLIGMLGMVLYGMYALNTGRINFSFMEDASKLNWCASRVAEIEEVNPITSYKIFQAGNEWVVDRGVKTVLEKTLMEKWLGEHCTLQLDEIVKSPPPGPSELGWVRVRLVNGQVLEFRRYAEGFHRYGADRWFKSNEWDVALSQLGTLGL